MKTFVFAILTIYVGFAYSQVNTDWYDYYSGDYSLYDFEGHDSLRPLLDSASFDFICTNYPYGEIKVGSSSTFMVGKPNKGFYFDSAYSGDNVIITDPITSYPVNDSSYFDLYYEQCQFASAGLRFKYTIDTDTLMDGFYITISFDKGQSWQNVLNNYFENPISYSYIDTSSMGDYCALSNGEMGYSGNSSGWKDVILYDYILGVKAQMDTIIYRFNFISDNIHTGKKGVMIDDIEIFSTFIGSVKENNSTLKIYPNPSSNYINISDELNRPIQNVTIYNQVGKLVKNSNVTSYGKIDISSFASGYYFLEVDFGNNRERQIFVKE